MNSVAKLAKSFGTPQFRKSWRLSLRSNRELISGRFLTWSRFNRIGAIDPSVVNCESVFLVAC